MIGDLKIDDREVIGEANKNPSKIDLFVWCYVMHDSISFSGESTTYVHYFTVR